MPMALANFATRRPMLPAPTMPSVLPASSVCAVLAEVRLALQSPERVSLSW
jgi:hypothetical protein